CVTPQWRMTPGLTLVATGRQGRSNRAIAMFRTRLAGRPSLRRHETLQLLVPMLHDDEPGRRGARVGPERLDHQEALTVGRHVVRAASGAGASADKVAPLEELRRRTGVPRRAAPLHCHARQRAIGPDVEEFLAAPCPERPRAPRRRDFPLAAADARIRPDVDFERSRTV